MRVIRPKDSGQLRLVNLRVELNKKAVQLRLVLMRVILNNQVVQLRLVLLRVILPNQPAQLRLVLMRVELPNQPAQLRLVMRRVIVPKEKSSVAIGNSAGKTSQKENSIILNASGAELNNTVANTFTVKPVREVTGATPPSGFKQLYYNESTGEIVYYTSPP